jgi:hypothetical protein
MQDFRNKHLWVKKATGLGITELFLRLIAWLCLRNDDYRAMLGNCKMILESGLKAIDPCFDKLIVSLRTAVANEMKRDKQETSFNDLLGSLILALTPMIAAIARILLLFKKIEEFTHLLLQILTS